MPGYIKNRGKRRDGTTKWQARWAATRRPVKTRAASRSCSQQAGDAERVDQHDGHGTRSAGHTSNRGAARQPFTRVVVEEYRDTWSRLAQDDRVGYEVHLLNRQRPSGFGSRRSRRSRLTTSRRSTTSSAATRRAEKMSAASWTCCAASSPSPSSAATSRPTRVHGQAPHPRPQAAASARNRAVTSNEEVRNNSSKPVPETGASGPARRLDRAPRRGACGRQDDKL